MKSVFTLFFLTFSFRVFCQIHFVSDISFDQAAERARLEKKLVFIHLESNQCQQCIDVATKGFSSVALKEKFERNFISLRANVDTERGKLIAERLGVQGGLMALFADADGNILSRNNASTSNPGFYLEQADVALGRRGQKHLNDYVKQYRAGERSPEFLKEYMLKRREQNMPVEDILDEYVGQLPAGSLQDFNTVKFIYKLGPCIGGNAYKLIATTAPRKLMDSLYGSIPYPEAVAMNNAIIENSFRKAVQEKDEILAGEISMFVSRAHGRDYAKGRLASSRNFIRYWLAVKDTEQYMRRVSTFLDDVHMRLTVDSLKKMDEFEMRNQTFSRPEPGQQLPLTNVKYAPPSQFYYLELNEHAWRFFEMANEPADLERALKWSRQSVVFFKELNKDKNHPMKLGNPAYMDTYAQIAYKLGRVDEAIEWQTKAVEAQKITGNSASSLEATLAKMKAGK